MSIDTLQTITLVSFIVCGVFCVISIVLFFVFKIPDVIDSLSGRAARKEIENIAQRNKLASSLMPGLSLTGNTKKMLKEWDNSVRLKKKPDNETVVLAPNPANETMVLTQNTWNETTVLAEAVTPAFSVDVDISFYQSSEIID